VGIKNDKNFGPVILFGIGGIYAEYLKANILLVPPFGNGEVKKSIMESKMSYIFRDIRNKKGHNLNNIEKVVEGMGQLALETAEIRELDINPLFAYNDGRSSLAVDVKIII
jgi:acetyl-CoA synthetase (ADP-forming)